MPPISPPPISPDQLQWVLDHNLQIRAGHRVQIAEAVQAWRAVEVRVQALEREVARLTGELDAAEQHVKILRDQFANHAIQCPQCHDVDLDAYPAERVEQIRRLFNRKRST